MSMNLSNIAVLNINNVHFCCIINRISKNEAINSVQKYQSNKKEQSIIKHRNLLSHTKIRKEILSFGDIK